MSATADTTIHIIMHPTTLFHTKIDSYPKRECKIELTLYIIAYEPVNKLFLAFYNKLLAEKTFASFKTLTILSLNS